MKYDKRINISANAIQEKNEIYAIWFCSEALDSNPGMTFTPVTFCISTFTPSMKMYDTKTTVEQSTYINWCTVSNRRQPADK